MASLTNGHESEWTLGVGDGQGGLACCNSWDLKESDRTERLNCTDWCHTYTKKTEKKKKTVLMMSTLRIYSINLLCTIDSSLQKSYYTLHSEYYIFFFLHCEAYGIFVPQPWIEPRSMAMKVHVLITGLPGISKYLILYLKVFTFWPLSENFKQQNLYSITSLVNSKHLRTVTQDIKIIEDEIYPNLWLPVFTCVGTLKESSFICPLLCYR